MGKASRVIVLAEDSRHQSFVRRLLYKLGYERHDIYFEPVPHGRGCGEQWVRERFPKSVEAYRNRHAKAETALVTAIDADVLSVQERFNQLGVDRTADEAIAILVPKRHIETWVLCLSGEAVDESTDYRHRAVDQNMKQAALLAWSWARPGATVPDHCVESLRTALPELLRIPKL